MKKIILAISACIMAAVLLIPAKAMAADTQEDFRIWSTANLNIRATKSFHINMTVEGRFYNLLDESIRPAGKEPGLGLLRSKIEGKYIVCKYFNASAGYTLFYSPMDSKLPANKLYHRIEMTATGVYPIADFTLSLREMLQTDIKNNPVGEEGSRRDLAFFDIRSCLKIAYNIPKSNFSPYVSVETFNSLNSENSGKVNPAFISQIRTIVGTNVKIDKRNSLNLYFMAQTMHTDVIADQANLILGISYTFGCGAGYR